VVTLPLLAALVVHANAASRAFPHVNRTAIATARCQLERPPRPAGAPRHRVAIAAVINNEGRWLAEWIMYHRLVGVDHFYLYDDASTDDTRAVVRDFARLGWATLHESVDEAQRGAGIEVPEHIRFTPQFVVVQHAARTYASEVEWLGLFDPDEFLFATSAQWPCVGDRLRQLGNRVGVLRVAGALVLPPSLGSSRASPGGLSPSTLLLDSSRNAVPTTLLERGDRQPLHKSFARPRAIASADHGGIHNIIASHASGMRQVEELDPPSYAHFRVRTAHDLSLKQQKSYAGHAAKPQVWSRLRSALDAYLAASVALPADHPLLAHQQSVRRFHRIYLAWRTRPEPRLPLPVPLEFGRDPPPSTTARSEE
jgi:hypothetical protein